MIMDMNEYGAEALVKAHIADLRTEAARAALLQSLPRRGLFARIRAAAARMVAPPPSSRVPATTAAGLSAATRRAG
jgi:hypothetical protein